LSIHMNRWDSTIEANVESLISLIQDTDSDDEFADSELDGLKERCLRSLSNLISAVEDTSHLNRSALVRDAVMYQTQGQSMTEETFRLVVTEILDNRLASLYHTQEAIQCDIEKVLVEAKAARRFQECTMNDINLIPLLVVISQPEATSVMGSLHRIACDVYRVHFLCSCCGELRGNGHPQHGGNNKGYKLSEMKVFFKRLIRVVQISLVAIQLLANVGLGVPFNVSPFVETCSKALYDMAPAMLQMVQEQASVSSAAIPNSEEERLRLFRSRRPRITLEDVMVIRDLLEVLEESVPPEPDRCNLTMVHCQRDGSVAWVCRGAGKNDAGEPVESACEMRFKREGRACLLIDSSMY
jgi:hypothetical protein